MKDFLVQNVMAIIATIFGAGGFYDSWKQRKKNQADALDGMQRAYDKYVEDSNEKFEQMRKEIADLTKAQKELKEAHHKEMERLKNYWKEKYDNLKKEFDNYKKRKNE